MNKLNFMISLIFLSFSAHAQILNGGFEEWASGEPVNWLTNNIDTKKLTLIPITQTSDAHSGSFALKGEVLETPFPPITYHPVLLSGSDGMGFSFSGQPDTIRGYYKFNPVGGDGLLINIFIMNGQTILGIGGSTIFTPTGPDYQEALFNIFYIDTVTIPNKILLNFQIFPAGQYANVGTSFYIDDFPTITMIKPPGEPEEAGTENLVFIAGETDTIKWNGGGPRAASCSACVTRSEAAREVPVGPPGQPCSRCLMPIRCLGGFSVFFGSG